MVADLDEIKNNLLIFIEAQKFIPVTPSIYKKGKKTISYDVVAKEYCVAKDAFDIFPIILKASEILCQELFKKVSKKKADVVLENYGGFYTEERSKKRLQQLFFCENPNDKGYILTPKPEGDDYYVSDEAVNVHVFKKDLTFLGEGFFEEWTRKNLIVGSTQYLPWGKTLELNDSDVYLLNTYVRPKWHDKVKGFRDWRNVHPIIRCFYEHLFPIKEQRLYAFNWMACSIQCTREKRHKPKLSTYLTLIGDTGLGKGICIEHHMRYLHGTHNYMEDKTKNIGEKFSVSSYLKKTLVHFSEAAIKDEDSYDALKGLESVYQGVEHKHGTAALKKTFFNVVWACNHFNRMRYLDSDDRRFAIMDLTSDKIYNKKCVDEETGDEIVFDESTMDSLLYDEKIIITFVEYLLGLDHDYKLAERPLKDTQRYKEVMLCSRPEWISDVVQILLNVDWESPSGSLDRIGYKEIQKSKDKESYYTYLVPLNVVLRITEEICKKYKMRVTKMRLQEEIKKFPSTDVACLIKEGYFMGVRVRVKDHDRQKDLMRQKFILD